VIKVLDILEGEIFELPEQSNYFGNELLELCRKYPGAWELLKTGKMYNYNTKILEISKIKEDLRFEVLT